MGLTLDKIREQLLVPTIQEFIQKNENEDEQKLLLKNNTIDGVSTKLIVEQILGRRKSKEKLPTFYQEKNIIYPAPISIEQSSSEETAKFKLSLVENLKSGFTKELIGADLTGGFGVDSFYISKAFTTFHFIERNETLLEIAKHNYQALRTKNIIFHTSTAEDFVKSSETHFDFIFIDPSRRTVDNKKVYAFKDCEPDIISLQSQLFHKTKFLLIKASPLLDIQQALKELKFVRNVYVLSLQNECKEVLFLCENNIVQEPTVDALNMVDGIVSSFTFKFSQEREIELEHGDPKIYLYEPNASILKAGAFKSVAKKFALTKIHTNTHLYTSDDFFQDFPGRIFKIISSIKPDPKTISEFLPDGKANITTRNYPMSVEELKKKARLKDGGEKFVIGFSGKSKKFLVIAERLK